MENNEMSVSISRQIGSTFVVIGTEVGAGILALPILIAHMGFPLGSLVMLIVWALMTYTALLLAEANLALEDGVSFAGMAKQLLGFPGQVVVWLSFLVLLYTIMVAYISAAGSAFDTILHIGPHVISLVFVSVLATFVIIGTTAVDWVNRVLLSSKLLLLLFVCIVLTPHVHVGNLAPSYFNKAIILSALPVFVTSFTSHLIIPPLRTYLKSDAKAIARVVVIGSLIPLFLYIIWIMGILGVVPYSGENSFALLFAKGSQANVGDILKLMKANLHNEMFYAPVSWFSNISVTTSFLGVSLALYYFLIDGFKLRKLPALQKHVLASVLSFVLPLIIVWFFPNIFIKALGYVGLCCSVLLIIIPFFMIKRLRQQGHTFKISYINNRFFLYLSLILGIIVVLIQLLS
jgi:amino acid permease